MSQSKNSYASQAVIFIPGIKGTTLVNTNKTDYDTIWSAIQSHFEDLDQLELSFNNKGLMADTMLETIIKPGQIEGLAYREVINDIEIDKPVYLFNYDWRKPTIDNGKHLQAFMDSLVEKSKISEKFPEPIKRFDFICHSQGSFIARQLTALEGFKRIGKVVLATPPLLGTLDIVDIVLTGEGFFPRVRGRIRKLLRTIPGGLELLPRYPGAQFHNGKNKPDSATVDYFNFNHWQQNITRKANNYSKKFTQALDIARNSINKMDDWSKLPPSLRKRIIVIARDGYPTMQSLKVYKQKPREPKNYVDLENAHLTTDGDGRVPHVSSCAWHHKITTLMATDSWRYRDYPHGMVLKDERVQKVIHRFLTNDQFSWEFPGHSIKQVTGLVEQLDGEYRTWQAVLE